MEAVAITKYVENFDGLLLRSLFRTENVINFRHTYSNVLEKETDYVYGFA